MFMTSSCLRFTSLTVALLLMSTAATKVAARTWTDAAGKRTIDAEMTALAGAVVELKRTGSGEVVRVPLAQLSEADRKYAIERAKQLATVPKPLRRGEFQLEAEGADAKVWADVQTRWGVKLKEGVLEMIRADKVPGIKQEENQNVSWEVYVPESYDGILPFGLFVYIHSGDSGKVPGRWKEVLNKRRLIWLAANRSGNKQPMDWRHSLAVDGTRRVNELYALDPERVYISGHSGGGRTASMLMLMYADLYSGGFPHVGVNPYRDFPLGDGKIIQAKEDLTTKERFERAKQSNRFVFLTGEKDFNRTQTKGIFEQYREDEFKHVTYLEVPGMGHSSPDAAWFDKGIVALDAPLKQAAEDHYKKALADERTHQLGAALEGYRRAASHGDPQKMTAEALGKFVALRKRFDKEMAELREFALTGKLEEVNQRLEAFRQVWGVGSAK